jgi:hypothetical protein
MFSEPNLVAAALVQPYQLVAVLQADCGLVIGPASTALSASLVTPPIQKVGNAEVIIGGGFTAAHNLGGAVRLIRR